MKKQSLGIDEVDAIQSRLALQLGAAVGDEQFTVAHVCEWAKNKFPRSNFTEINKVVRDGLREYKSQLRADGHN